MNSTASPNYPEVRTRMKPALRRTREYLVRVLGTTPPGAIRILIAQANAPRVAFDATAAENSESATRLISNGALLYTTQSTAEKQTAHCSKQ